jgi:hypothetical protein
VPVANLISKESFVTKVIEFALSGVEAESLSTLERYYEREIIRFNTFSGE